MVKPRPLAVRAEATATAVRLNINGRKATHSLRIKLHDGETLRIGRVARDGAAIPWDISISREHADLSWQNGLLYITCLQAARNPICWGKHSEREAIFRVGESFRIGTTDFCLSSSERSSQLLEETNEIDVAELRPAQSTLRSFTANDLREVGFRHAEQQLEILAQLPSLISESQSDSELGQTLCRLLMEAIPHADAVAVAHYNLDQLPKTADDVQDEFPKPVTMRIQTRDSISSSFKPSRSMIVKALRGQESVLHVWDTEAPNANFTVSEGLGWAVCAPIRGESCAGWCMYVSGRGSRSGGLYVSTDELAADLRFTELLAQFIGSVRQVRRLQEQKSKLNAFFSPKVIDGLTSVSGTEALEPAERDITVLFCDVRGFSRKAEQLQDDLFSMLKSVRAALGVMVDGILERDGAIADFQGDAAMGFWGWPVALEYGPIAACRAAIAIQNEFRQQSEQSGSLLEGFSVGIGIAHGRAIAGQIGTEQQSKVGVFGPVVNQCARLESMTKQFGVSICIDGATAEFVDRYFSEEDGRLRPLARVRPQGMLNAIDVFNLLPPENVFPEVDGQTIAKQQLAYEAVSEGRWNDVGLALSNVPDSDGPKQFLLKLLPTIRERSPNTWDGIVPLSRK